jgi:acetylornithine deacetylase/succinyl-diaminopimelate desuccinylase-like protein
MYRDNQGVNMIPATQPTEFEVLAALPAVARARRILRDSDDETVADLLELVQIPAPSLAEGARAARFQERCLELGLAAVELDQAGNVIARLPAHPAATPAAPVVIAAHLDTVFPAGTDLTPRHEGDRIYAPGIGDNTRGLATLLALARALLGAGIRTVHPVVLVATVGEEGNGDLKGVKHLFREGSAWREAAAFIGVDGTGLRRVVHQALGSRRLRVVLTGPGGHSWADWGRANPIHAAALAIAELAHLVSPDDPHSTLTVGRIGGGTSINTIPAGAWFELDLRSEDGEALVENEARARAAIEAAVEAANTRRRAGTEALGLGIEVIGDRPAGRTSPETALVQAACAATRYFGEAAELVTSSTDANVPISLGIPAITLGAGGRSGGAHTTDEWYENDEGATGLERLLLTILAVAGVA